jgi:molecular chaperone DnaK (HSP70)
MTGWALDLGTHNSGLARWDGERPALVDLPRICRVPGGEDPLEAPRMVPSAVHAVAPDGLAARLGASRLLSRRVLWGQQAWVGREALERSASSVQPELATAFKPYLGHASTRVLARVNGEPITAREAARRYLRELVVHAREATGERIRALTITAPVDSYEAYRAEVAAIARAVGIDSVKFADEPVAAALGYGLAIDRDRHVLVVDFGAGTLDLALVRITPRSAEQGGGVVVAKEGRAVGGDDADRWLLESLSDPLGLSLPKVLPEHGDEAFWYRQLLAEARRVKEAVFFREAEAFLMSAPSSFRRFDTRVTGGADRVEVTRIDVERVLRERGLHTALTACMEGIDAAAREAGVLEIDDVLMVGGSTLLPGVYKVVEERYGRDRVRAWQPFEAVAYGAAALAAGAFHTSDFIVHDYAVVTYDARTHEPQYTLIVPRGTRFPTETALWRQRLVPTCSLGEPESMFKLVICELGSSVGHEHAFTWDAAGSLKALRDGDRIVVPLNEANPALGTLDPPHPPDDKRPRLEIAFGVNANRWLVATVQDLRTQRTLMKDEPVVRLL